MRDEYDSYSEYPDDRYDYGRDGGYAREAEEGTGRKADEWKRDFSEQMREAEQSANAGNTQDGYRFLGLIPMPAVVGAMLRTVTNPLMGMAGKYAQNAAQKRLQGTRWGNPNLIAFAAGAVPVLADDVAAIGQGLANYKRALGEMGRQIAPTMKSLKGGHGFYAVLSVSEQDNEVIYAHRRRLGSTLANHNLGVLVGVASKVPNGIDLITNSPALIGGRKIGDKTSEMLNIASGGLGSLGDYYKTSLKREHQRLNIRPSAYMLIERLGKELQESREVEHFTISDRGGEKNFTLPEYIACIFQAHQEDMAKLNPAHAPIRKGLGGKLMEVSELLAEELRKGNLHPEMLVRLVGERKVVKNNGRAIAKPHEVRGILEKMAGIQQKYEHIPHEKTEEMFTDHDVREMVTKLKGEELDLALIALPNERLKKAGVSETQIEAAEKRSAKKVIGILAESALGLDAQDDKALTALGHDANEIAEIRDAAQDIRENGVEAVNKHRSSREKNKAGIDNLVVETMLEKIGDIHYLGTLRNAGKAALKADAGAEIEAQADIAAEDAEREGHAERLSKDRKNTAEAATHLG
jgi:hypothetical protein